MERKHQYAGHDCWTPSQADFDAASERIWPIVYTRSEPSKSVFDALASSLWSFGSRNSSQIVHETFGREHNSSAIHACKEPHFHALIAFHLNSRLYSPCDYRR